MSRKRNPTYCVRCGKSATSRPDGLCSNCPKFIWDDIPDNLWHQFVGLFIGEGCAIIRVNHSGGHDIPYASLAIALREDDREILDLFAQTFGGSVAIDNHGTNPQVRFVIQRNIDVLTICNRLIEDCVLPGKKLQDVRILINFSEWRRSQKFHGSDYSYGLALREKLMASRAYNAIRGKYEN